MSEKWSVEPGRQSEKHWSEVLADSVFQLAESVCEGLIDLATATREQTAEVVKFHAQDRDHADGLRSRHSADMALDREASGQVVEQYVSVFREIAEALRGQDAENGASEAQGRACDLADRYSTAAFQTGYERGWKDGQDWEREKRGLPPAEGCDCCDDDDVEVPDTITGGKFWSMTFDSFKQCLEFIDTKFVDSPHLVDRVEAECARMDDGEWIVELNVEYTRPATDEEKGE